jgi:hypothetical protein
MRTAVTAIKTGSEAGGDGSTAAAVGGFGLVRARSRFATARSAVRVAAAGSSFAAVVVLIAGSS